MDQDMDYDKYIDSGEDDSLDQYDAYYAAQYTDEVIDYSEKV